MHICSNWGLRKKKKKKKKKRWQQKRREKEQEKSQKFRLWKKAVIISFIGNVAKAIGK
jgi:hypothetical protein